jgi:transcriptional regulator with XRE-family HTH domain
LRFAAARIALGMSQADVCKIGGLPSAQISQWETGKHRPSLDALVALLPLLEVDLDYLFLGDQSALRWEKRMALENAYEQAIEEAAQREAAVSEKQTKTG